MSINVVLLRLAVSSSYRRRMGAGGRTPFGFLVVFPAAALATVIGVGSEADPYPWVTIVLLVPLFTFAERRRRRLLGVPASELSPMVQRWRDGPGLVDLVRHPIRSTTANVQSIAWMATARRLERQWERDRGLR